MVSHLDTLQKKSIIMTKKALHVADILQFWALDFEITQKYSLEKHVFCLINAYELLVLYCIDDITTSVSLR